MLRRLLSQRLSSPSSLAPLAEGLAGRVGVGWQLGVGFSSGGPQKQQDPPQPQPQPQQDEGKQAEAGGEGAAAQPEQQAAAAGEEQPAGPSSRRNPELQQYLESLSQLKGRWGQGPGPGCPAFWSAKAYWKLQQNQASTPPFRTSRACRPGFRRPRTAPQAAPRCSGRCWARSRAPAPSGSPWWSTPSRTGWCAYNRSWYRARALRLLIYVQRPYHHPS